MDDKIIKAISDSIIENLPEAEKLKFNAEERKVLELAIKLKEENKNNPDIVASCNRTLENMKIINDRIKFKAFVDASIDIAAGLIFTGTVIAQPELAPIIGIISKQIAKKAKEIY